MTDTNKTKRGRKKISEGGKKSPREIFVACAALVDGKLVLEEIHCEGSDKYTKDSDVLEEATTRFKEEYGVEPAQVGAPRFPRKEVGSSARRDTLNISMEDVIFVPNRKGTAVYKGWKVAVKFIEDHDEAVYIIYKSHTKEQKKTKPVNKVVRLDALENLVESASRTTAADAE